MSDCTTITLRSVRKSGRVLFAFTEFYLPFSFQSTDFFFSHFDLLAGISMLVYEEDGRVEESTHAREPGESHVPKLRSFLKENLTMDSAVEQLLLDAENYYDFEVSIKEALPNRIEDLLPIVDRRSFDFRIMHRALFQKRTQPYDEILFSWFRCFETLMEIEDDFSSITGDELNETFNIVWLARRIDPGKADHFVDSQVRCLTQRIVDDANRLRDHQAAIAHRVFDRYRQIVPARHLVS